MPTRNIVLTDHQTSFIDRMIAEGTYQNASEVMREGLRRLEREEAVWEAARQGVLEGLAQIERGEFAEGTPEQVFERALRVGKARAKARKAS